MIRDPRRHLYNSSGVTETVNRNQYTDVCWLMMRRAGMREKYLLLLHADSQPPSVLGQLNETAVLCTFPFATTLGST